MNAENAQKNLIFIKYSIKLKLVDFWLKIG